MARPAAFQEDTVLDTVVQLFWKKGFEATSMQDLVDETGLNRSSLYNSFGSKEELFLRAMDHYIEHYSSERLAALDKGVGLRGQIQAYFDDLIHFSMGRGKGLGCLLTNSAVELAPHDAVVQAKLKQSFENVRLRFLRLLKEGQQQKELSVKKDAEALASFFLSTIQGIRVLARSGASEAQLKDIAAVALSTLE